MNYAERLKKMIKDSGLSLSQIADSLRDKGFSTDKGYISKLQNGRISPAGEDLNRALAEVTGGSAERLIFAAYMEKAPEGFMDMLLPIIEGAKREQDGLTRRELIRKYEDEFQSTKKAILQASKEDGKEVEDKFDTPDELIQFLERNNLDEYLDSVPYDPDFSYMIFNEALKGANEDPSFSSDKDVREKSIHEIYLEEASNSVIDPSADELDQVVYMNAILKASMALDVRINQIVVESIVEKGMEKEWAVEYIEGLTINEKLESALKNHLDLDITSEFFYPDLLDIIQLRRQITHGIVTEPLKRFKVLGMITTIERAIQNIEDKAKEMDLEI